MPRITFSQILKNSVERETTSKGWCSRCQRYQTIATRKTIHSIPDVLLLNTAITNQEQRMLWSTPGWLPEEIGIIVEQGQFFCYEGEDLKLHLQRGMHNITVYSLIGMAINIESGQTQKSHLVSMVNGKLSLLVLLTITNVCSGACGTGGSWREPVAFIQRFLGAIRQHRRSSHFQPILESPLCHGFSSKARQ